MNKSNHSYSNKNRYFSEHAQKNPSNSAHSNEIDKIDKSSRLLTCTTTRNDLNSTPSKPIQIQKKVVEESIVISSDSEQEAPLKLSNALLHNNASYKRVKNQDNSDLCTSSHKPKQLLKRKLPPSSFSKDFGCTSVAEKKFRTQPTSSNQQFTIDEIQCLFERDKLSQQIRRYWVENKQQSWFLQKKWDLAQALESTLNNGLKLKCEVFIVGSSINGCGRFNSDCDMCLVVDRQSTTIAHFRVINILNEVRNLLRHASFVRNLQIIPAKVRILKFRDAGCGMECDLNVNNLTGLRNTQLIYAYTQQDPRITPIILCVKEWAHQNDINDASMGTLSSYAIVLMVIHYLQFATTPCVSRNLQALYQKSFSCYTPISEVRQRASSIPVLRSSNRQSLSDLLIGFFKYFATFDFDKVISIRRGNCFLPNVVLRNDPWYNKPIRIEEPFDLSNVARAVRNDKFYRIHFAFQKATRNLKPGGNLSDLITITKRSRLSLMT